jgi:hypothetical protein
MIGGLVLDDRVSSFLAITVMFPSGDLMMLTIHDEGSNHNVTV